MKVRIERDECSGDGICQEICPDIFDLGADGISFVLDDEPPEELVDKVEEAMRECPNAAISVED